MLAIQQAKKHGVTTCVRHAFLGYDIALGHRSQGKESEE